MTDLDMAENQFLQGILPVDIGLTLPNLKLFGISANQFTESISVSLSNASRITLGLQRTCLLKRCLLSRGFSVFCISMNRLGSGKVNDLSFISLLTNATDLEVLALNSNNFGGVLVLPESLSNLSTKLTRLSGSIPKKVGDFVNLEDIQLRSNQFIGNIPPDFGKLLKIQVFDVSQNSSQGKFHLL